MWDLSLDHHCVFCVQGAAHREGSRKGDAGFHLVHILVLPLQPRAPLHARVPVWAIGIHDGQNFKPRSASYPDSWKGVSVWFDLSGSADTPQVGIKSSGRFVVDSSKQQSLCVLHTHAGRVNIVSRRWHSRHLSHTYCQVSFENKNPSGKRRDFTVLQQSVILISGLKSDPSPAV